MYKLPNIQDMFALLSQNGAVPDTYSVIDSASAVKTATSQFQRVMGSILSGLNSVMVRVDKILLSTSGGVTPHMEVIKQVFGRLAKHKVKLNGLKCQFFKAQVKYVGHILSKEGISPVKSKLDAIRLAPRPTDMSQVRSFLGMLNYYSEFIKDFPSKMNPL